MDRFHKPFGSDTYAFDIDENEGILVYGCDCASEMSDEEAKEIYFKLQEYLIEKELIKNPAGWKEEDS